MLSQQTESHTDEAKQFCTEQLDQLIAVSWPVTFVDYVCMCTFPLQEMEDAIEQASALRRIKQMKQIMTPRLPPLHNRTLSGNILDATLGVLHTPDPQGDRVSSPMETSVAELNVNQTHQPEVEQRLVVAHDSEKETSQSGDFNVQEANEGDESKTYANVRLSADSIPLQLSSDSAVGEVTMIVDTNQEGEDEANVKHSPAPLQQSSASRESLSADTNQEDGREMNAEDSPSDSDPQLHLSTADVIGELSPLAEEDQSWTSMKDSPIVDVTQEGGDTEGAPTLTVNQEDEASSEGTTALLSTNQAKEDRAGADDTSNVYMDHETRIEDPPVVSTIHGNEENLNMEDLPVVTTHQEGEVHSNDEYPPAMVEGNQESGTDHPPLVEDKSVMNRADMFDSGGAVESTYEPIDLLQSGIEDQVLELAVIEPKSDVPMPVEYTVVTQQEITDEPTTEEEAPPPPPQIPDYDRTNVVIEDGNESGESITIGCEVTTSTMELTDVTELSSGNMAATTERQMPDLTLAQDISCETVIITTSAMNSSRTSFSASVGTPSDSDATTNSLEENHHVRGVDVGAVGERKSGDMITANDDGTDSDVVFEDILKQIESAPYELRISPIVLAQLSMTATKTPDPKKKRKRRSMAKKWTRTKARKSTSSSK